MPQVFKIGSYWVYFWSNENKPLEPVHVHVAEGAPTANATKIWITRAGKCYLCNNNSEIPELVLRNIMKIIEARSGEILQKWHNSLEARLSIVNSIFHQKQKRPSAKIAVFYLACQIRTIISSVPDTFSSVLQHSSPQSSP